MNAPCPPHVRVRTMVTVFTCIAFTFGCAVFGSDNLSAQSQPTSKPTAKPAKPAKPVKRVGAFNTAVGLGAGAGGKFGGRRAGRRRLSRRLGSFAKAIEDGLGWIVSHQSADGGFDAVKFMTLDTEGKRSDGPGEGIGRVGITGFCLLPILGDGNTLRAGPRKDSVKLAVRWLRRAQNRGTGAFSENIFEHAIATYAIAEASGLSGYKVLNKNVVSGIAHLVAQQNADGGWNHEAKGKPSDPFTTCHAIMAYRSARDFKLVAGEEPMKRALAFIKKVSAVDGTVAALSTSPLADGTRREATAIAASLMSRFFLGREPWREPSMIESAKLLSGIPAIEKPKDSDQVFEYMTTYSLYQMGGRYWRSRQDSLVGIVKNQRQDGNFTGSWDPLGKGAMQGGRLYSTALSVLTLEAYYRYTRLVR